jgi:hypothetical protein
VIEETNNNITVIFKNIIEGIFQLYINLNNRRLLMYYFNYHYYFQIILIKRWFISINFSLMNLIIKQKILKHIRKRIFLLRNTILRKVNKSSLDYYYKTLDENINVNYN